MLLALTVGRCSGVFLSMLFIICFLQELNPLSELTDLLYLWRAEKEETYKVEEYIIGSGENKPRLKTATILAKGSALQTQISNPKRWEVHLGLVLKVNSQDKILLKKEHAKPTAASSKVVVCRSSSRDESELALAGVAVASADLASQISQVKSKEGLKKCTACRKRVGLTGFSCKCGDLFCAVHLYSNKHNYPFNYSNAGHNAIAKANPIIVAENLIRSKRLNLVCKLFMILVHIYMEIVLVLSQFLSSLSSIICIM
ncbi:hypothetical protein CQW23_29801 [Capsicum baccatum]|uniref:AN1-type domain-containing protein n=1 Tax=Capsicum baccatum TaxID=33114 RepID=A0A2G2VC97_CAPBA|nr:hypothetical protein CQW23_29801 [Capsicum baccatum]